MQQSPVQRHAGTRQGGHLVVQGGELIQRDAEAGGSGLGGQDGNPVAGTFVTENPTAAGASIFYRGSSDATADSHDRWTFSCFET
jgi:hypothetical protein